MPWRIRRSGAADRSGAYGLQTQLPAARRRRRLRRGTGRGRCARPFQCGGARVPLFHRVAQEPLYPQGRVALLPAAGCGADGSRCGIAFGVRRFYLLCQTELQQQDQYLPHRAGRLGGVARRSVPLYDPCRPFSAQYGAGAGGDAGRRGRGRYDVEEFRAIVESRDLSRASGGAPAEGLYLWDVAYPAGVFRRGERTRNLLFN